MTGALSTVHGRDCPRGSLPSDRVEAMLAALDKQLDFLSLETQPEVALRVLSLASDDTAGLLDYASAIKTDHVLTGRILRLANSALYAQRKPVATVERACILVGIDRLRALALGFYLTRATATDTTTSTTRRIWGESLMRGCLASRIAATRCPEHQAEAFVIGLMLEAGIPIARRLAGDAYAELIEASECPEDLYARELATQPFTHVDVITLLLRKWRLPEVLALPIERHHASQPSVEASPLGVLCRIARYVGSLRLGAENRVVETLARAELAAELLELVPADLVDAFERAAIEYSAIWRVFGQVLEPMREVESLAPLVHNRLIEAVDAVFAGDIRDESKLVPQRFSIGGSEVEICLTADGTGHAYLCGLKGERVMGVPFRADSISAEALAQSFGLHPAMDEAEQLDSFLRTAA